MQKKITNTPSPEDIEKDKKWFKWVFREKFYSKKYFDSLGFDELRSLIFSMCEEKDENGDPLGVYVRRISPIGERPVRFGYYINALLFEGYLDHEIDDIPELGGNNSEQKNPNHPVQKITKSSLALNLWISLKQKIHLIIIKLKYVVISP